MHKEQASCSGVDEAFVVHSTLFLMFLKNKGVVAFNHSINIALNFTLFTCYNITVNEWVNRFVE